MDSAMSAAAGAMLAMVGAVVLGGALMDWKHGRGTRGEAAPLALRAVVGAVVAGGGLALIAFRLF